MCEKLRWQRCFLLTIGALCGVQITIAVSAVVKKKPIDLAVLDLALSAAQPPLNVTAEQIEDYEALMSADDTADYVDAGDVVAGVNTLADEDTRSLVCIPILRIFSVQLRKPLQRGERVAIVGDHIRLGAWQVEHAPEMKRAWLGDDDTWSLAVPICTDKRLHYRYFTFSESGRGRRRVQQWEGVPYGRVLEKYHMYSAGSGKDIFGQLSPMILGDVERERGWLRFEYVIEFKFVWAQQLRFYNYLNLQRGQKLLLRMAPYRNGAPLGAHEWGYTQLEVSQYVYNRSEFRTQPLHGVRYIDGNVVIFRFTETLENENSGYHLSIATVTGHALGQVVILPWDVRESEGVLRVPIQSPTLEFQVGMLTLPYVVIRPLIGATTYNMRGSFQRYWPMNWPALDVGRRGMGASFDSVARTRYMENTIASFLRAYALNADMVELDVQLTRDYVPVVWHDFGFKTAPAGRYVRGVYDLQEVLIKDLTYRQLKAKRVFAVVRGVIYEYTRLNVHDPQQSRRIFPTLRQVYEVLPKSLGVIVEIKWPQLLQSGQPEAVQTIDKNHYVDVILRRTMQHGCGRPLIFASFDADICTMVRLKQNAFPAMFITEGETGVWEPYRDLRTRSHLAAVNFAQSANLLGTVAPAADFLGSGALLDYGLDLGQAVFVWGHALDDTQTVAQFKRWHATGIIYDRIDMYGPRQKRSSFFNETELQDIFARQCIVVGHANCSSATAIEGGGLHLHGNQVSRRGCEVIVRQHG